MRFICETKWENPSGESPRDSPDQVSVAVRLLGNYFLLSILAYL